MAFSWVTQPLFGAPALPGTAGRGRPQPSAALSLQGRWPTSRAATFLPVSITPSSNALFKESGREEAVERPAGHCREQGASSPGLVRGAGAARGQPRGGRRGTCVHLLLRWKTPPACPTPPARPSLGAPPCEAARTPRALPGPGRKRSEGATPVCVGATDVTVEGGPAGRRRDTAEGSPCSRRRFVCLFLIFPNFPSLQ